MKDLSIAFESTCDDASVCVSSQNKVLYFRNINEVESVERAGGVVPELIARSHTKNFMEMLEEIDDVIENWQERISRISFSSSPGFIGSIIVSKAIATMLAMKVFQTSKSVRLSNLPKEYEKGTARFLEVNHLDGHLYSGFIGNKVVYPFIGVVVSGGHTQMYYVKSFFEKELVAETRDDAIGESYDKIGRYLKLPFPWGENLDKVASKTKLKDDELIKLPSPLLSDGSFSYSGIKSKIIQIINNNEDDYKDKRNIDILIKSFQEAAQMAIMNRIIQLSEEYDCKNISVGGGVANNTLLRSLLKEKKEMSLNLTEKKYCNDNALMINHVVTQAFLEAQSLKAKSTKDES